MKNILGIIYLLLLISLYSSGCSPMHSGAANELYGANRPSLIGQGQSNSLYPSTGAQQLVFWESTIGDRRLTWTNADFYVETKDQRYGVFSSYAIGMAKSLAIEANAECALVTRFKLLSLVKLVLSVEVESNVECSDMDYSFESNIETFDLSQVYSTQTPTSASISKVLSEKSILYTISRDPAIVGGLDIHDENQTLLEFTTKVERLNDSIISDDGHVFSTQSLEKFYFDSVSNDSVCVYFEKVINKGRSSSHPRIKVAIGLSDWDRSDFEAAENAVGGFLKRNAKVGETVIVTNFTM